MILSRRFGSTNGTRSKAVSKASLLRPRKLCQRYFHLDSFPGQVVGVDCTLGLVLFANVESLCTVDQEAPEDIEIPITEIAAEPPGDTLCRRRFLCQH